MTTTMNDEKIKRKRGRKPVAQVEAPATAYDGPSLDEILRLSDQQVQVAFDELGVEPSPFRWNPEDDQLNVAAWHNYGLEMSGEDAAKTAPKNSAEMRGLEKSSRAIHNANLRTELLMAHLQHWISGLEDTQLLAEVERLSGEKFSESARRYAKVSDLRGQLEGLMWPVLIDASKLYSRPTNPLGGN